MSETMPTSNSTETATATTGSMPSSVENSWQKPSEPVLRPLDMSQKGTKSMSKKSPLPIIAAVIAIAAGVATGWGGAQLQGKTSSSSGIPADGKLQQVATGEVKAGDVFGVPDEQTFKDSAEGYLEIGGLDGEGSHKLIRVGGISQTVYLTSSITDLDKFDGMNVKVWGETFKGQKAGWLMDVGRIQVVNPQGQAPAEE
jgi:hypothetical protein